MNIFLVYAFMFFTGSLAGWWLELFFRRFFSKNNKERRWINPGFLNGPYLPIYGFGVCALYTMTMLEDVDLFKSAVLNAIVLFLLMAAAMTVIEYIAGVIFIKYMKIKLWDYSDEWLNLNGIICPKFSFFWAILSAVYYFAIHPYILSGLIWLSQNLAFSFFIGFFFGVFIIDVCVSLNVLVKLRAFAADNGIIIRYERLKAEIREKKKKYSKLKAFILQFRTENNLYETLQEHLRNLRK